MSQCLSSAVCNLKLLGSLGKTETSLRSLNLSLLSSVSFFSPNFHKEFISSLTLMRSRNSTKSALYLFATDEQVLDFEEFDASKEDLESGVYQITM